MSSIHTLNKGPSPDWINALYEAVFSAGEHLEIRGQGCTELIGVSFFFGRDEWFIKGDHMPVNYDYIKEELRWYHLGREGDDSIRKHAKIWEALASEGTLNSNYGVQLNNNLTRVVEELINDPNSRRAVVLLNRPEHNYTGQVDVPCTMYLQFLIRGGRLHMIANMRSQDAYFGLRNDLPAFQFLKMKTAWCCDVPPGNLYLRVGSWHIYDAHLEHIKKNLGTMRMVEPPFTDYEECMRWLLGSPS